MIIVSDTTPLSELAKVGRLAVLRDVYGHVMIPREVYNELTAATEPAVIAAPTETWIEVREVSDPLQVPTIQMATDLGLGECGAFALAEELSANRVLIDDLGARREALRRNLPIIGTVGILLLAKQRGLLFSVKEVLDDMIANGMRISPRLYRDIVATAGE